MRRGNGRIGGDFGCAATQNSSFENGFNRNGAPTPNEFIKRSLTENTEAMMRRWSAGGGLRARRSRPLARRSLVSSKAWPCRCDSRGACPAYQRLCPGAGSRHASPTRAPRHAGVGSGRSPPSFPAPCCTRRQRRSPSTATPYCCSSRRRFGPRLWAPGMARAAPVPRAP